MNASYSETTRRRSLLTPEGVDIRFDLANAGERILGFLIDFVLIHVATVVLVLLALASFAAGKGSIALSFAIVTSFFLRNFYFIFMELRWSGRTVGKKLLGLRIISRDGGPLTAEAVLARNLTRDLEVFLPLLALFRPSMIVPSGPGWGMLIGCAWLFVFALFPLLNKDCMRIGDIIGGTLVVKAPEPVLLPDLATEKPYSTIWESSKDVERRFVFTTVQLDLYGIHELQVLEDVLRRVKTAESEDLVNRVCAKIKKKIRWPREDWHVNPDHFLLAFYKAQRARLEHRMMLGDRRERKELELLQLPQLLFQLLRELDVVDRARHLQRAP